MKNNNNFPLLNLITQFNRLITFFLVIFIFPGLGQSDELDDVMGKNLSELMLMDVTITSVNKRPQKLSDVASAIYVLTAEDVKRSGATNIMEALRMVPGLRLFL